MLIEELRPKTLDDVIGQELTIKILKGFIKKGKLPHMLFYGKAGTGKCVTKDSTIFVDNVLLSFDEFKEMKNDINNSVLSENGKNVKGYLHKEKSEHTIKVELEDGTMIEGTEEHKIKVIDDKKGIVWKDIGSFNGKEEVLVPTSYDIFPNEKINVSFDFKINKYANNIKKIPKNITIDEDFGYFMGCFIANGTINGNTIAISTHKNWLQKKIYDIMNSKFSFPPSYMMNKERYSYPVGIRICSIQIISFLKKIGIEQKTARYKDIPLIIRKSPKSVQISFLRALLDCDSWFNGNYYIQYTSASKKLAFMTRSLLINLGIYCKISKKKTKKYNHTYWNVTIPSDFTRKLILYYFDGKFKNKDIVFHKKNNTNVFQIPPDSKLKSFVRNKLNENEFKKCGTYNSNGKSVRVEEKYTNLKTNRGLSFKKFNKIAKLKGRIPEIEEITNYIEKNNVFLVKVRNVKKINKTKNVYDFHIPKNHTFICNNLINHNTTSAIALARDFYGNDWQDYFMEKNASDDRRLQDVRTKVKDVAQITVLDKPFKILFLDEVDSMDYLGQNALRRIMEKYSDRTVFILSCNYKNKLIEPLRNRCVSFHFHQLSLDELQEYIKRVCNENNIDIKPKAIEALAEASKGSVRTILSTIEKFIATDIKEVTKRTVENYTNKITDKDLITLISLTKQKQISQVDAYIDNVILAKGHEPQEILEKMRQFIKETKLIYHKDKPKILQLLGDIDYRISQGATPEIQLKTFFCYLIYKIRK
jgi:DNA polymerase III delta prime subunit